MTNTAANTLLRFAKSVRAAVQVDDRTAYRHLGYVLVVVFGLVAIILIWLGAAPITGPWDVVSLLNACWRILNGQVPHIDYHNPIGPLTYYPIVLGMKVVRPSTSAIAYGTVLIMALLLPWLWALCARRLGPWTAALLVLFEGFLLIAPRPLGYGIRETTYAMIYNREGYVLLSMLLIGLFLPPKGWTRRGRAYDGLSIGLLLGLLFYCKITYFAVAAGSALLGIMLYRRARSWFLMASVGFLAVFAVFYACFHINPVAYLSDIVVAGQAQLPAMRVRFLKQALVTNLQWIYVGLALLVLWTYTRRSSASPGSVGLHIWIIAAWIVAAALFIDSGNAAQRGGVDDPLFFLTAVIVLELLHRQDRDHASQRSGSERVLYAAGALILLPLFGGRILGSDVASFSYSAAWNLLRRPSFEASREIRAGALRDLRVPAWTGHITSYWPAREFPKRINEGLELVRKHLTKADRITTMGFTDPFSLALGIPPARDGNQWWDLHMSFDRRVHPSAEEFLGDVTLVMVPNRVPGVSGWSFDAEDAMWDIYGRYLTAEFERADSSESWTLYRRR